MKILFVQDSLGGGGAERSNADLWYFLNKISEIHIKIVVLDHQKIGLEKEILANEFDVAFLKKGSFLNQVKQIKNIILEFNPDIVQSVLWRSTIRTRFAKLATNFYHIESIVNCSYAKIRFNDPNVNKAGLKFYKYLDRFTEGFGVDKFLAITHEVKEHTILHLKVPVAKIEVIPRGRAENDFLKEKQEIRLALSAELNSVPTNIFITHVGRQEYQKGHLDLLEAIKLVDKKLSALNLEFVFCGKGGNASPEIEKFLKENKLQTKLHWLGHRADVNKILAASDIFVFPSLYEGLGGALIEAQAASLPVICSDIKVFEEVVPQSALTFSTGNSEELSKQLIYLASSPELMKRMGQDSLGNFEKRFMIEDIHAKMLSLYKEILK